MLDWLSVLTMNLRCPSDVDLVITLTLAESKGVASAHSELQGLGPSFMEITFIPQCNPKSGFVNPFFHYSVDF